MWTIKLCITTSFTISILFSPTPALNVVFRFVYFYFAFSFSRVFLVSSWSKALDIFPHPHTHTYGQFGALSQAPTQPPPQTICLICFVFSNELDVKFNTHTHMQKKHCAELFLFEFFDSQSRKLLKRVKVSQKKKKTIFFMIIEKEEDEAVVVWRSKKHPQIKHTNTYPSTHIFVYCRNQCKEKKWSF